MLKIKVTEHRLVQERFSSHTEYLLVVTNSRTKFEFWERYSSILRLKKVLSYEFPNIKLPFPPKKRLGKTGDDVVKFRKSELQKFFDKAVSYNEIVESPQFQMFLRTSKPKGLRSHGATSAATGSTGAGDSGAAVAGAGDMGADSSGVISADREKEKFLKYDEIFRQLSEQQQKYSSDQDRQEFQKIVDRVNGYKILFLFACDYSMYEDRSYESDVAELDFQLKSVGIESFDTVNLAEEAIPDGYVFDCLLILCDNQLGATAVQNEIERVFGTWDVRNKVSVFWFHPATLSEMSFEQDFIVKIFPVPLGNYVTGFEKYTENEDEVQKISPDGFSIVPNSDVSSLASGLRKWVEKIDPGDSGRTMFDLLPEGSVPVLYYEDKVPLVVTRENCDWIRSIFINFYPLDNGCLNTDAFVLLLNSLYHLSQHETAAEQ